MSLDDFRKMCRARWVDAILSAVGSTPPKTSTWRGLVPIMAAIAPFIEAANHLNFPVVGGGYDVARVTLGHEPGTIEFVVSEKAAYVAKPSSMTLEYIAACPSESFVIIDLDPLPPSGVSGKLESHRWCEELVELSPGNYADRGEWDAGYIGYDSAGNGISVRKEGRLLIRIFRGRLMLVSHGSLWKCNPKTYDGRHDRMTNGQIRDVIEHWIPSGEAA